MIDAPTNLTRNILIGMFAGFVVGAIFYYTNLFGDQISSFVEKYVFLLGSTIFINLLKMLIVPLIFLFIKKSWSETLFFFNDLIFKNL